MLVTPGGGVRHLERHLDRISASARALGFTFDRAEAVVAVQTRSATLVRGVAYRLRLQLSHDGQLQLAHAALQPLDSEEVTLRMAPWPLPEIRPLSAHKTTLRAVYDAGVRAAEEVGAFDSLFFTADGRLVEGGRSSVFVRLSGRWWTPPVADGALPGVMRAVLLADPAWQASERSLSREDLFAAEEIVVCNALRGAVRARLSDHVGALAA